MNLLVDIGNTRIKWAQQSALELASYGACLYNKSDLKESPGQSWSELSRPEKVYISNVGGEQTASEISELLFGLWEIKPVFLSVTQQALGVTNGYDDARQLGIDRWLAIIAAWNNYQSTVCVIDCGTAITVDVVTTSGQHLGGYIVPGLSLMTDSLNRQTQQIDSSVNQTPSLALGRNTKDCISNGALMTVTALISGQFAKVRHEHGMDTKCIISGGFAGELSKFLELDIVHDPHLVLNGIALMSENL